MSNGGFLKIQPTELKFPFELKKQSSCCLQLTNKTDQYVAFKVKTTNPKKYCVRPNTGIVLPGSTCDVTVTMQAQKEAPPDLQCKDKFLLQSIVVKDGATTKDITPEMFNKEPDKVVEEFKLRVIYIPANPPSPVPEESEEGSSPRSAAAENGSQSSSLFDAVTRSFEERSKEKPPEASLLISKLTEEKTSAIQINQKLRQELKKMENVLRHIERKTVGDPSGSYTGGTLCFNPEGPVSATLRSQELLRKELNHRRGGFSVVFVAIVGLLGVVIGYILKKA